MSPIDFVQQLGAHLRSIETSTRDYDAGNLDDAIRIAKSLTAIFHHTQKSPSLLAHLQSRLIRLVTSVDKPPYPRDWYSPMADIEGKFHYAQIDVGASPYQQPITLYDPPKYRPMLDRKKMIRQVQAPEWWGNEPVIIVDGKKTTRKDIALWAGGKDCRAHEDGAMPTKQLQREDRIQTAIDNDLVGPEISAKDAHFAALWQMAYEVLNSPELVKLAQ